MKKKSLWTILLALICLVLQALALRQHHRKLQKVLLLGNPIPHPKPLHSPREQLCRPRDGTGDVTVSGTAVTEDTNNPGVKVVVSKGDLPSSCSQVQVDIKPTPTQRRSPSRFSARPKDANSASKLLKAMRPESLGWLHPGEYAVSINDKEAISKVKISNRAFKNTEVEFSVFSFQEISQC